MLRQILHPMMRKSTVRLNFALLLLMGIFILNFYMFLTLPSNTNNNGNNDDNSPASSHVGKEPRFQDDPRGVSHLQFPRKRLNKSNYSSDSVGVDLGGAGRGGGGARGGGGGARGGGVVLDERERDRDSPPEMVVRRREDRSKQPYVRSGEMDDTEKGGGVQPQPQPQRQPPHPLLLLSFPHQDRKLDDPETKEGEGRKTWREKGPGERGWWRGQDTGDRSSPNPDPQHHQVERFLIRAEEKKTTPAPAERKEPSQDGGGPPQAQQNSMMAQKRPNPPAAEIFRNNFTDPEVDALVNELIDQGMMDLLPDQGLQENYWAFLRRHRQRRKSGIPLPAFRNYRVKSNWERFHKEIRQHALYDPDSAVVPNLIKDLANRKVVDVEQKDGGTQIKLILAFDNGGQALFKPMRFPRETQTLPDHFYFADYERHIAEIAAFHLDRILGYNRVPPVTGRLVNMTRDIKNLADSKLTRTFFISPAGNLCFHGTCSYYCDSSHPVCGHPDLLEGSLMAFLPADSLADRLTWRNPWRRSYSKRKKAYWEHYGDLCDKIILRPPYNVGRRLLDIVDMSVLDFLMGNQDRHHYETFENFGNDTFLLHLDNGRGFGKQHEDDLSCLAPLTQCCRLRLSTLQRLARLYGGPHPLSLIMKVSLSTDQVSPVLIEPHLQALDRRLMQVLKAVQQCVQKGRPLEQVILDDGVY